MQTDRTAAYYYAWSLVFSNLKDGKHDSQLNLVHIIT